MTDFEKVKTNTAQPSVYDWNENEKVDNDLRALIGSYKPAIKRFLETHEAAANEEQFVTRVALEDMLRGLFENTSEDESYKTFSRVYERDNERFKADVMALRGSFTNYTQLHSHRYSWAITCYATEKFFGMY